MKMMGQMQGENATGETDMQPIGKFLSFASRGDKVGLNQMLMDGTSPDVQDYDNKIALHLAASEGHAPIVELLLHCKANVNLVDRWQRTFLGSIVHGEEMILITEYLPKGNLDDILTEKGQIMDNHVINNSPFGDTKKDVCSFGFIFYQMLEGRLLLPNMNFDFINLSCDDFEPKFRLSKCPTRNIQHLSCAEVVV